MPKTLPYDNLKLYLIGLMIYRGCNANLDKLTTSMDIGVRDALTAYTDHYYSLDATSLKRKIAAPANPCSNLVSCNIHSWMSTEYLISIVKNIRTQHPELSPKAWFAAVIEALTSSEREKWVGKILALQLFNAGFLEGLYEKIEKSVNPQTAQAAAPLSSGNSTITTSSSSSSSGSSSRKALSPTPIYSLSSPPAALPPTAFQPTGASRAQSTPYIPLASSSSSSGMQSPPQVSNWSSPLPGFPSTVFQPNSAAPPQLASRSQPAPGQAPGPIGGVGFWSTSSMSAQSSAPAGPAPVGQTVVRPMSPPQIPVASTVGSPPAPAEAASVPSTPASSASVVEQQNAIRKAFVNTVYQLYGATQQPALQKSIQPLQEKLQREFPMWVSNVSRMMDRIKSHCEACSEYLQQDPNLRNIQSTISQDLCQNIDRAATEIIKTLDASGNLNELTYKQATEKLWFYMRLHNDIPSLEFLKIVSNVKKQFVRGLYLVLIKSLTPQELQAFVSAHVNKTCIFEGLNFDSNMDSGKTAAHAFLEHLLSTKENAIFIKLMPWVSDFVYDISSGIELFYSSFNKKLSAPEKQSAPEIIASLKANINAIYKKTELFNNHQTAMLELTALMINYLVTKGMFVPEFIFHYWNCLLTVRFDAPISDDKEFVPSMLAKTLPLDIRLEMAQHLTTLVMHGLAPEAYNNAKQQLIVLENYISTQDYHPYAFALTKQSIEQAQQYQAKDHDSWRIREMTASLPQQTKGAIEALIQNTVAKLDNFTQAQLTHIQHGPKRRQQLWISCWLELGITRSVYDILFPIPSPLKPANIDTYFQQIEKERFLSIYLNHFSQNEFGYPVFTASELHAQVRDFYLNSEYRKTNKIYPKDLANFFEIQKSVELMISYVFSPKCRQLGRGFTQSFKINLETLQVAHAAFTSQAPPQAKADAYKLALQCWLYDGTPFCEFKEYFTAVKNDVAIDRAHLNTAASKPLNVEVSEPLNVEASESLNVEARMPFSLSTWLEIEAQLNTWASSNSSSKAEIMEKPEYTALIEKFVGWKTSIEDTLAFLCKKAKNDSKQEDNTYKKPEKITTNPAVGKWGAVPLTNKKVSSSNSVYQDKISCFI